MSGTSGITISWNRCFLCSSLLLEGLRKRNEIGGGGGGGGDAVKLLLKYLLSDFSLESPLAAMVMSQWTTTTDDHHDSGDDTFGRKGGGGNGGEVGGGVVQFSAKLCTACEGQARSLAKLQRELEAIQIKIVRGLEEVKKAVISNSRLFGRNDEVKEDFDVVEEQLSQVEADGGDCSAGRKFLEAMHHFQTFVFENERTQVHVPLDHLKKFTFTGKELHPHNLVDSLLESAELVIKEEPEDYFERLQEDADDINHDNDIELPVPGPLPLPEVKFEAATKRRRRKRKSAQLAPTTSRRRRQSLQRKTTTTTTSKKPKKLPKSDALLLYRRLVTEKEITPNTWLDRKGSRHLFTCDECGLNLNYLGRYGHEQHLKEHETTSSERNYECPDCKIRFKQKQYFQLHLFYHSTTHECEICKDRHPFLQLESHLRGRHQLERIFPCGYCSMWTPSFESLATHLRLQHPTFSVKCELCPPEVVVNGKMYSRHSDLHRHLSECHGKTSLQFPCSFDGCSKVYYSQTALGAHLIFHKGLHSCSVCKRSFQGTTELDNHTRREHPDQAKEWFECDSNVPTTCSEKFATQAALHRHQMLAHDKPKLKCELCHQEFLTKPALQHHGRKKHGVGKEMPKFACSQCDLHFTNRGRLSAHTAKEHTGEKDFICETCGFKTHASEWLRKHKRKVHGNRERKFKCSYCPDAFYDGWTLKTHIRRHTGERPHQCEECGATFNQPGALNTHKKKHGEGRSFAPRGPRGRNSKKRSTPETVVSSSSSHENDVDLSLPPPPPDSFPQCE